MLFGLPILFCLPFVASQTDVFYNPPARGPVSDFTDNKIYKLGSPLTLKWQSSMPEICISMHQDGSLNGVRDSSQPFKAAFITCTNESSYEWTVEVLQVFDLYFPVYWFVVANASLPYTVMSRYSGQLFTSHYFNITGQPAKPTPSTVTTSITDDLPSSAPSSTPSAFSSAVTSTSSSNIPMSSSDTLATESNRIALGIGLGFGIPSMIIGVIGAWIASDDNSLRCDFFSILGNNFRRLAQALHFSGGASLSLTHTHASSWDENEDGGDEP
ncbi:hypothetical protein MMC30_003678 [Trapelia coarctata]|nr:hypothetical protein [Trapelia coarctata]